MNDGEPAERSNVVRFPVELRLVPSITVIAELEPDAREVFLAGDLLGLELPPAELRDRVDEETARYIAEQILPLTPAEQRGALDGLLRPVLAAAVEACRRLALASERSGEAARKVEQVQAEGVHWIEPLEGVAYDLQREATELMIEAHGRCQEAHGVARAVGMARRGEAWTPYDPAATSAWLAETGHAVGQA